MGTVELLRLVSRFNRIPLIFAEGYQRPGWSRRDCSGRIFLDVGVIRVVKGVGVVEKKVCQVKYS